MVLMRRTAWVKIAMTINDTIKMHSAPLYNEQWDSRTPCAPFTLASLAALFTLGLPDLLVLVILT